MGTLPGWMPVLIEKLTWGCSVSPWFIDLADGKIKERGQKIIYALWPFMKELPQNIRTVRDALPAEMSAASQLLNRLSDDESKYQGLFIQQFPLAGVTLAEVESATVSSVTKNLCDVMTQMCTQRTFAEGIHSIVAAELAATMYCRASLPLCERYFEAHTDEYEPGLINEGLEWVRLHAKTHMRHAIWMKRMLDDLNEDHGEQIPEAAQLVLDATLALWECPMESIVGARSN